MTWDYDNSIVRIIDKTNPTPTGITEGGLIDGDLLAPTHVARIVQEKGDGKVPSAILSLYIPSDGMFVQAAPILIDKDAPDKYLIEIEINQIGRTPELQRYRLSTPYFTDDPDLGEIMQIPLESIAYNALAESLGSINDELLTPKQRVINILDAHNGQGGTDNVLLTFDESDIDIPDSDALQFDYTPTSPKPVMNLLQEVIDRIEQAGPLGGVFKNFFYDTTADPNNTNLVKIFFEEFGNQDSGVIIDPDNPQEASPNDKTLMTSNKKRKKITVTKFGLKSASLLMDHTRFASEFIHAQNRSEWDVLRDYLEGDPVKWTDTSQTPNIVRFFTANSDIASGGNDPNIENVNWFEDFTIIPEFSEDAFYEVAETVTVEIGGAINFFRANTENGPSTTPPNLSSDWTQTMLARPASSYEGFFSYSPMTSDLDNAKQNLADIDSPPSGYIGYAVDWNYERVLNDIPDFTNRFRTVTGKSVRRIENNPPTGLALELYNGFRVLVGTAPTGVFVGHENQIAEFTRDPFQGVTSEFRFSDNPVDGDTIPLNHDTGEALKFDGVDWVAVWTISNNNKPAPIHLVRSARLVKDSVGIPGQATEQRFDWKDLISGGEDNNRTSRGAWYNVFYPYPIRTSPSTGLGGIYGGDGVTFPPNPQVNHINLNQNRKGLIGWNRGIDSEDLGRISEHTFKPRIGFWRSTDESEKSKGKANLEMIYWRKDNNNRFFFKDFIISENNEFTTIKIPLPPFGPTNLYFNRLDELAEVLGYTIPFDFFIKEKEFSGVRYEWRKNQSWGIFLKQTYNNTGMYVGCYRNYFDSVAESATQLFPDILEFIDDVFNGNDVGAFVTAASSIDHVNLAIGEEYYVKEGYAIFPTTQVSEPRYDFVNLQSENDYLTARAKSESHVIKNDFYPNERHIACGGDIDIKYGQLVTETGSRVPGGSLSSVVSNIKETFDNKGFNSELFLVRKFVI